MKTHLVESLGSPDIKVNLVGMQDIASSTARVVVLALDDPSSVPDWVRVTGDNKSFQEIAEIFSKVTGERITVKGRDWEKSRDELVAKAQGKGYLFDYLQ